jgi:predicted hydrolase (HD superfamily)
MDKKWQKGKTTQLAPGHMLTEFDLVPQQGDTILDEVESCLRQEECEDDIFHVVCSHCGVGIDPNENPVYVWNFMVNNLHQQLFCCEGCDAEHRVHLTTVLQVRKWRRDNG